MNSVALPQPLHLKIKAGQSASSAQASILVSSFLSNDILAGSGGATIRASLERLLEGLKEEELEKKERIDLGSEEKSTKKRRQSENGGKEERKSKKTKAGN